MVLWSLFCYWILILFIRTNKQPASQDSKHLDGYVLIQVGILSGGWHNLNNYIPDEYQHGYSYKFITSFRNTGGGDNHHTNTDVNTGIVYGTDHVDHFMYMIFAKKI